MSRSDLFAISGVLVDIFAHICVYSSAEFIVKLDLEELDPSVPNVNYLVKSTASKNLNLIICLSVQTEAFNARMNMPELQNYQFPNERNFMVFDKWNKPVPNWVKTFSR